MAEPPMFPPPPAGRPPSQDPPPAQDPPPTYAQPWAPPGAQPWAAPVGAPPGPYGPYSPYGYARTEPFAIVSLVASLAAGSFCFVGPVVAIVFGHIARSRIKRSGDNGSGMALAGLIIGYVEIALGVVVIAVIILLAVNADDDATGSARRLGQFVSVVADREGTTPRDADVVRLAIREAGFDESRVFVGSSGTYAVSATKDEFASEGWRLEVHRGISGRACLSLPESTVSAPDVSDGSCPYLAFPG